MFTPLVHILLKFYHFDVLLIGCSRKRIQITLWIRHEQGSDRLLISLYFSPLYCLKVHRIVLNSFVGWILKENLFGFAFNIVKHHRVICFKCTLFALICYLILEHTFVAVYMWRVILVQHAPYLVPFTQNLHTVILKHVREKTACWIYIRRVVTFWILVVLMASQSHLVHFWLLISLILIILRETVVLLILNSHIFIFDLLVLYSCELRHGGGLRKRFLLFILFLI